MPGFFVNKRQKNYIFFSQFSSFSDENLLFSGVFPEKQLLKPLFFQIIHQFLMMLHHLNIAMAVKFH